MGLLLLFCLTLEKQQLQLTFAVYWQGAGCCAVSLVSLNPPSILLRGDGTASLLVLDMRKLRHKEIKELPNSL